MPFNIKEKVRKKDTYYLEPLFQGFIFRNELGMSVYFSPEEQGQLRSYFNTILIYVKCYFINLNFFGSRNVNVFRVNELNILSYFETDWIY
jgi:hypothetical protein